MRRDGTKLRCQRKKKKNASSHARPTGLKQQPHSELALRKQLHPAMTTVTGREAGVKMKKKKEGFFLICCKMKLKPMRRNQVIIITVTEEQVKVVSTVGTGLCRYDTSTRYTVTYCDTTGTVIYGGLF